MSMKKLVFAGLLGVAAVFATGCADKCEKAANTIEDKQKECGLTIPDSGDSDGEEAECTDAAADAAQKLADCIDKAACEKVKDGTWITSCGT
jgi:hypothetical protein